MSGLSGSRVRLLCDCIDWHVRISYHHYHSQEMESDYEKYFFSRIELLSSLTGILEKIFIFDFKDISRNISFSESET